MNLGLKGVGFDEVVSPIDNYGNNLLLKPNLYVVNQKQTWGTLQ